MSNAKKISIVAAALLICVASVVGFTKLAGVKSPAAEPTTPAQTEEVAVTVPSALDPNEEPSTQEETMPGVLRLEDLKPLFEKYKATMLKLAKYLPEKNIRNAAIGPNSAYYFDNEGNKVDFNEEITNEFAAFIANVEREINTKLGTEYVLSVFLEKIDGRRLITFNLGDLELRAIAQIFYMPDGFVDEGKNVTKLADKWYCLYGVFSDGPIEG